MAIKIPEREDINHGCQGSTADRSRFQQILEDCIRTVGIDVQGDILIVGGSFKDAYVLHRTGFRRMTLSNIEPMPDYEQQPMYGVELSMINADVQDMAIADGSYDLVLAHEVLHHCRSPHRALLEMLRVSRKHVIIMEPNDSIMMQAFVKLRFSFPYELPAVTANNCEKGGVENTSVPNYIYRWNRRDMYQATAAYMPESDFDLHVRQYWDFNVNSEELARRSETRIASFTEIFGPALFLAALRGFQGIMNRLPLLRGQGNKLFGCVTKRNELKPWIVRHEDKLEFNRNMGRSGPILTLTMIRCGCQWSAKTELKTLDSRPPE